MENQNPQGNHNHPRRGTNSVSDAESQASPLDSFHSPLPSNSPSPLNSKALVTLPPPPTKQLHNFNRGGGVNKLDRREGQVEHSSIRKAALGFRVCEFVLCLVSFSVMAADRGRGWPSDSFHRYKEYRYCLAVNVIGFVYAGFQGFNSAFYLANGKHIISYYLHYHFEFLMDQILAYLLMSASSSAATRVDDWVSNWGKDTFTEMATASVGMSFLAFFSFAISSLISGYNLCNRDSN